jgi:hypothetical protein
MIIREIGTTQLPHVDEVAINHQYFRLNRS